MAKSMNEVLERFRTISIPEEFDLIVAIADGGIVPAGILCRRLNIPVELLHINLRDEQQQPRYEQPRLVLPISFETKDKRILLVDDRVKSGSTLRFACELLSDAKYVRTFAVNGIADYALYNEACFRFPWII
jgi:hypoxanthine phosphoribosyltransferase